MAKFGDAVHLEFDSLSLQTKGIYESLLKCENQTSQDYSRVFDSFRTVVPGQNSGFLLNHPVAYFRIGQEIGYRIHSQQRV